MGRKVALDLAKNAWRPSVLAAQITLVSTTGAGGTPEIAPAAGITLAAPSVPVIAFPCDTGDAVYRNISNNGEFVVNIPGEPLVEPVWMLSQAPTPLQPQASGLTLAPAQDVKAPLIEECRAHLECRLDSVKQFGAEALIFGKVIAASMDEDCQAGTAPEQYFRLRPIFSLEQGVYGSLDGAKWFGAERSTSHPLFAVRVGDRPGGRDEEVVKNHFVFLRGLRSQGRLLLGGPFPGGPGGLYIFTANSLAEAEQTALQDPLVQSGAPFTAKPWIRTF